MKKNQEEELFKWVNHFKDNKFFSLEFGVGIDTILKKKRIKLREGNFLNRELKPYSFYLLYSPKGAYSLIKNEEIDDKMNFIFGFLFTENGLGHIGSIRKPGEISCHIDNYGKTQKFYEFLSETLNVFCYDNKSWEELRAYVKKFSDYMEKFFESKKPVVPCF